MIQSNMHLALARERQADLLREARKRQLVRLAAPAKGPGLRARLAAFAGKLPVARRRSPVRPAAQPS